MSKVCYNTIYMKLKYNLRTYCMAVAIVPVHVKIIP